ncbi:MAG: hypothetical protein ABW252_14770 [Polyangiales bacterium]
MTKFIAMMGALALASCADVPLDGDAPNEDAPYDDAAESATEGEGEIASIEQAVGELACSSVGVSAVGNANGRRRTVAVGDNIQASPDWTYHNGGGCPYQYITEYTGFGGIAPLYIHTAGAAARNASTAARGPLATITNPTDCARTRLTVGVYIWNANTPGYNQLHTFQGRGQWVALGLFPPYCATQKTSGSLAGPTYTFTGNRYKVRVAGRVEYCRPGDGCVAPLHTDLRVETKLVRKTLPIAPL